MRLLWIISFVLFSSSNLYAYTKGKTYKLTILHTNDHHGRFWPNKDGEWGLAARATLVNQIRGEVKAAGGHSLLIDAGDINTGVPQSDLQDAEPDFKGMSLLEYDVMAVGNHEFDKPLQTIFKQREWAGFPFISANIFYQESGENVFPTHIKKQMDDLEITIMGLTTEDTPVKSNPQNTAGLVFKPAVEVAKTLVPKLRKQTDVLIALTHIGHYPNAQHGGDAPGDVTLAREVSGIDLIVGGHTQLPLFKPDIQNGAIIVQAYEWGKYLGRVDLEFLDGVVTLKNYELIPINHKDSEVKIEADSMIEEFLRPFKEKGDSSLQVELGATEVEFIGKREVVRFQETNLGNLVASAYKNKFNADLAIANSGGLRDSIYPGEITYESVLMVLPFAGEIALAKMNGAELKVYLQKVITELTPGSGAFPQMSGVEATVNDETKEVTKIKINGQPISDDKIYKLALPDFIAAGGDKYPIIKFTKFGYNDADVLKDFILQKKNLSASDYAPTGYIQHE